MYGEGSTLLTNCVDVVDEPNASFFCMTVAPLLSASCHLSSHTRRLLKKGVLPTSFLSQISEFKCFLHQLFIADSSIIGRLYMSISITENLMPILISL